MSSFYQVFLAKRQKGPVGLRVKLPHFYLLTTLGGGFTLSHVMLKIKQESCEYQFFKDPTRNRTRFYCFNYRRSIFSTTDRLEDKRDQKYFNFVTKLLSGLIKGVMPTLSPFFKGLGSPNLANIVLKRV